MTLAKKSADVKLENYVLTTSPNPHKNIPNLTHFNNFCSNCVGDPFGPQAVGARTSKAKTAQGEASTGTKNGSSGVKDSAALKAGPPEAKAPRLS